MNLSYFSEIPYSRTRRCASPSYTRSPASRHRKCGEIRLRLDVDELEKSPSMRAPMRSEPLWLKLARRIPHPPVCCRPVRRARRRRRRPADPWRRPWCQPEQLTDLARGGEGTLVNHGSGLAGPGVALYAADAVIFRENRPDGVPLSHCQRIVSERLVHGAVAAPQQNPSKITR